MDFNTSKNHDWLFGESIRLARVLTENLNLETIYLLYSREQKHVSISDTPMLLFEINSISNMGRQK